MVGFMYEKTYIQISPATGSFLPFFLYLPQAETTKLFNRFTHDFRSQKLLM